MEIYDFENDPKVSERRKQACKKEYGEMNLEDVDKFFSGAFVYDKKTGEITGKKPRSITELCYLNMRRNYDLLERIVQLEEYVDTVNRRMMKLIDDFNRR